MGSHRLAAPARRHRHVGELRPLTEKIHLPLGFDELIDPRETRDQLLDALRRGLRARQAAAEPVARTVILP